MKNKLMICLAIVLMMSLFFATGATAGPKEDAVELVKKGCEFIQKNGLEKAIEAFKTSDFQKGELHLFAADYKGLTLAQGVKPELIGKNLWGFRTPSGRLLVREQVDLAQKGGGWIEYEWNHETKKVLMTKQSYIMPIQGMEAYVGCGFYKED